MLERSVEDESVVLDSDQVLFGFRSWAVDISVESMAIKKLITQDIRIFKEDDIVDDNQWLKL